MKDYKKNRRKKVRNIVYYGASQYWSFLLDVDIFVLVRNSARDSKKGDKLAKRWLGPYQIHEYIGKGVYKLSNSSGRVLKKTFNSCR